MSGIISLRINLRRVSHLRILSTPVHIARAVILSINDSSSVFAMGDLISQCVESLWDLSFY